MIDLHLWFIGPGHRAAIVSVATTEPCSHKEIDALIPDDLGIAHLTIEIIQTERD